MHVYVCIHVSVISGGNDEVLYELEGGGFGFKVFATSGFRALEFGPSQGSSRTSATELIPILF